LSCATQDNTDKSPVLAAASTGHQQVQNPVKPGPSVPTSQPIVILSEAKNPSVTTATTARTFASEGCHNRVFQTAPAGLGCGTTVACAIRDTTERFFASLRMTTSGTGASTSRSTEIHTTCSILCRTLSSAIKAPPFQHRRTGHPQMRNSAKPGPPVPTPQPIVILSEVKNPSVTTATTARTFASEGRHNRVFQTAPAGLGCGTTVACAIRNTTERFFASLRMTTSGAGAQRTLNGLRFHQRPTIENRQGWGTSSKCR
jgi:hypothetical protein